MAASFLLKKKKLFSPNLFTGLPFRQSTATNCLTYSGYIFRQPNRFTRSVVPNSNATVYDFLTTSAVTFRQAAAYNRPKEAFCTSMLLTRSFLPLRRSTGAFISRFVNGKEFHVDVSGHDSAIVRVMKRLRDKLDPSGWWYLVFKLDEEKLLHVKPQKTLFRIGFKETDEGISLRMQMPGVDYHDMKVSVEDNTLFCENITAHGITHNFEFLLPEKTYQPSDVKGKIQNGVLWVTFTNLKKEDLEAMERE